MIVSAPGATSAAAVGKAADSRAVEGELGAGGTDGGALGIGEIDVGALVAVGIGGVDVPTGANSIDLQAPVSDEVAWGDEIEELRRSGGEARVVVGVARLAATEGDGCVAAGASRSGVPASSNVGEPVPASNVRGGEGWRTPS